MRLVGLILFLVFGFVSASSMADPAGEWLRADAPHVYLVRQGETEADAALHFVKDVQHWSEVWCPWPGYEPPVPVGAGDLLVRVRINGRSWIQRARRGDGDRPHARELEAFKIDAIDPFVWIPDPQLHPPQHIALDLAEVVAHEPARAVHHEVSRFWPSSEELPGPVIRVDAGRLEFLSVGTALTVVPAGKEADSAAWLRVVVVAVFPSYSYAMLLNQQAVVLPEDSVRGPTAWCIENSAVSIPEQAPEDK